MTNKKQPFNWSRVPSKEGVSKVYLADPTTYTMFNSVDGWMTKQEFINSLDLYNEINELKIRKRTFKSLFVYTLAALPFGIIIFNIITSLRG
jgi:hypothetical protein